MLLDKRAVAMPFSPARYAAAYAFCRCYDHALLFRRAPHAATVFACYAMRLRARFALRRLSAF